MKPIRFSPHAEANLVAREISRAAVEATIRQPDRREPSRPPREIVAACILIGDRRDDAVARGH